LRNTAEGRTLPVVDCRPGDEFWFVDEHGRTGPCSFTLAEHGVDLARLIHVADLTALPLTFRRHREQRRAAACTDCRSTQVFSKWSPPLLDASTLSKSSARSSARTRAKLDQRGEEVEHGA
jgi:hypothetical protein